MRSYVVVALMVAVLGCAGCTPKGNPNTNKAAVESALRRDKRQEGLRAVEPSPRTVRIGHYQCICHQGNFEENLKTVIYGLKLASEAKLDIVSFPESLLTGYFSSEKDARANCFAIDSPQMKKVLKETAHFETLFMVGFNELRGDKLYNTVAVIDKGRILGSYSKAFPCFGYFVHGREFPVFEKKGLKFGVVICADGGYIEPCRILALKGAKVVFAPHFNYVTSPVTHYQMVRNDSIARAVENNIYFLRGDNVVHGNTVEGLPFVGYGYGDSFLIDPNGEIVAGSGLYSEYLMIYNLDLDRKHYPNRNNSLQSARALIDILNNTLDNIEK